MNGDGINQPHIGEDIAVDNHQEENSEDSDANLSDIPDTPDVAYQRMEENEEDNGRPEEEEMEIILPENPIPEDPIPEGAVPRNEELNQEEDEPGPDDDILEFISRNRAPQREPEANSIVGTNANEGVEGNPEESRGEETQRMEESGNTENEEHQEHQENQENQERGRGPSDGTSDPIIEDSLIHSNSRRNETESVNDNLQESSSAIRDSEPMEKNDEESMIEMEESNSGNSGNSGNTDSLSKEINERETETEDTIQCSQRRESEQSYESP